jgi:hypothetical protein
MGNQDVYLNSCTTRCLSPVMCDVLEPNACLISYQVAAYLTSNDLFFRPIYHHLTDLLRHTQLTLRTHRRPRVKMSGVTVSLPHLTLWRARNSITFALPYRSVLFCLCEAAPQFSYFVTW